VIYNGLKPWNAPIQIRDLIALSQDSALWSCQPHGLYHLLDMSAVPGDELARRRSLAALLFRLERPLAPEELEAVRSEVSDWFRQHPDQGRLRTLFGELVRQAFKGLGVEVPQSINLLEMNMRSNLATIGERWRQEGLTQGRIEGEARGRIDGEVKGKAEALVSLLVERFGALAPSLRTRIQRARLQTLDRWFKRAIAAPNVRSVFSSSSR
jgi:hypothetical protein